VAVRLRDLTGDGKKDIVVTNAVTNTISVLKGNGDGTFQPAIDLPSGSAPNTLAIADVNADGKPDIIETNNGDETVGVFINQSSPGNVSFAAPAIYTVGLYPAGVVTGDFNHDGKRDIAVLNGGDIYTFSSPTTINVLFGNGDGTFVVQPAVQVWNHNGGDALAVGDFSGTGRLDLAVANFGYAVPNEVKIMRGNGNGTFTPAESYSVGEGAEDIKAADFNGDGIPDLVTDNLNDDTMTLLVGKGDGTFIPAVDSRSEKPARYGYAAFGYPTFIDIGDIDRDGRPDIVTGNIFNRTVTVLRNTTPAVFDMAKLLKIAGLNRAPDGHVMLECRAVANRTVRVEASSSPNGRDFVTIGSAEVDGSGTFEFEDATAAQVSQRFYRLTAP
jgi:hypothetical protein